MTKRKILRIPINRRHMIALSIIILTIVVLAGLMQRSLTLTVYNITSPSVPIQFDGFKIAHISDYHSGRYNGYANDVIKMTANQNPDIICLTGDIVDGKTKEFDSVDELIAGLSNIAPVYAVSGNNERYERTVIDKMNEIYGKYGVKNINGEKISIYNGTGVLSLFGIADPGGDDMSLDREVLSLKDNYNSDGFGIILYHRANEFEKLIDMGYHLVLSGHLHGGLVRIPIIGGMLSPSNEFFPKYSGGLYEKNGVYLVSNRGIGNNHPIPRVYNPPEVVVVILQTEG